MLDYTSEADQYDVTRGGEGRAIAAARAIEDLLPTKTRTLVDLACGTGIVTRRLLTPTRTVLGVDRSPGMLALASRRLPGPHAVVLGDATRLPVASASVDAVAIIWLLHLLEDAKPVLAECARVLRPGGVLITTVDKNESAFVVPSDVAAVTRRVREPYARQATDRFERVIAQAGAHGLRPVAETTFRGTGQGRSPRQWQEQILTDRTPWFRDDATNLEDDVTNVGRRAAELRRDLSALPDQETPRPDPIYRLIALA